MKKDGDPEGDSEAAVSPAAVRSGKDGARRRDRYLELFSCVAQFSACITACASLQKINFLNIKDSRASLVFPLFCSVLADANFPSASIAKHGPELVRADGKCCMLARWSGVVTMAAHHLLAGWLYPPGHGIPALLEAVTKLLPLDAYVPKPVRSS